MPTVPTIHAVEEEAAILTSEEEPHAPIHGLGATELRMRADASEQKITIVDPWAIIGDSTTKEETNEETMVQRSFSEQWGSFRDRIQTHWQASPVQCEDEAGVVVERASSSLFRDARQESKPEPQLPPIVDPGTISAQDLASIRARKISVTLYKETQGSQWGFVLEQEEETARIKILEGVGLLEHTPFKVGDTLAAINNRKCTNAEASIQQLIAMDSGTPITLLVEAPKGISNLVQAMVRKCSPDVSLGIGFYVAADVDEEVKQIQLPLVETAEDRSKTHHGVDAYLAALAEPNAAAVHHDPTSHLLKINNIDPNGILSISALSQGDIIVAINGIPCSQMKPEEANLLLAQSDETVTITAMKPQTEPDSLVQRMLCQVKRAGSVMGLGFAPTFPSLGRRSASPCLEQV